VFTNERHSDVIKDVFALGLRFGLKKVLVELGVRLEELL